MYVIVEIAGLQYKVEKDQQIFVNRLPAEEGETVTFPKVLLSDNGSVEVGAPAIEGMAVNAKVVKHLKGDKIIVFKKKRRKGYRVKNGFRPYLTQLEVVSIGAGTGKVMDSSTSEDKATAKPKAKKTAAKPAAKKAVAKSATAETESKATAKTDSKTAAKKATETKATETKAKASTKATEAKADTAKKAATKPAAKKAAGKGDDLTKVEGIGPKVKGIFNDEGIMTFDDLAAKTAEELKDILTPHGGRYAGMTTDTWPKQAKLAAEGKWDELKKWQDELDGGKE